MRVITVNVNGLRSAAKKGFFSWLNASDADVVCLQEIKATHEQLIHDDFHCQGYQRFLYPAVKPGYSGVAIYTRLPPLNVNTGLGWDMADNEGRYLQIELTNCYVASIYFPSGSSGEVRQAIKYAFLDHYYPLLKKQNKDKKPWIICGDWNIAHQKIDIKNWRGNQKNSGFLPEERAWLSRVLDELGYVDAFRAVDDRADQYTWWSNRGRAYEKNVGWRIDYQIVSQALKDKIKKAEIYREKRFSDHAPLIIEYEI